MNTPAFLTERGFSLRPMRDDDLPLLRELYASTRAEEMAMVPWPQIAKRTFLDQQFTLQHQHYLTHFADADFLAIEHRGRLIGRYYLQRAASDHLLVDISLFPKQRGNGLGSTLIRQSQDDAARLGRGMSLHVLHGNAGARRLYERLGFVAEADAGTHLKMRWPSAD